MPTPHETAVAIAERTIARLGGMFDALGSAEQGGGLYDLYRLILADLFDVADPRIIELRLRRFEYDALLMVDGWLDEAFGIGNEQASEQLSARGFVASALLALAVPAMQLAKQAIDAALKSQTVRVLALAKLGTDPALIFGDITRPGILAPGPMVREIARWLVVVANHAHEEVINQTLADAGERPEDWGKQAIAAIDERTTETCLLVHGQVKPFDEPFELSGKPWDQAQFYGFSNKQPPFHWWCRDTLALILMSEAHDHMTQRMRAAADAELLARVDGSRQEIHPANAFSRRGELVG